MVSSLMVRAVRGPSSPTMGYPRPVVTPGFQSLLKALNLAADSAEAVVEDGRSDGTPKTRPLVRDGGAERDDRPPGSAVERRERGLERGAIRSAGEVLEPARDLEESVRAEIARR